MCVEASKQTQFSSKKTWRGLKFWNTRGAVRCRCLHNLPWVPGPGGQSVRPIKYRAEYPGTQAGWQPDRHPSPTGLGERLLPRGCQPWQPRSVRSRRTTPERPVLGYSKGPLDGGFADGAGPAVPPLRGPSGLLEGVPLTGGGVGN